MRPHLPRIVVVLALLAGLAAFDGGTDPARADGATIVETGWWSRAPGTATPAGGFQVGRTPEGELSVAAIRVRVDGPLSKALVILAEAPGGFLSESGAIDACVTTATWVPAAPGALEDAPASDCSHKVTLQRNGAAGNWTADVLPLLSGTTGTVSLVFKPGAVTEIVAPQPTTPPVALPVPAPVGIPSPPPSPAEPPPVATPMDPGFTVEFSRADLDAASRGGDTAAFDAPSSTGTVATGGPASFAPTFIPTEGFSSSSSLSLTPSSDVLPAATPDVSPTGAGGTGTAASVEAGLQPVAASSGPATPWGRLVLLIPLSIAIGFAGAMARRTIMGTAPVG